MATQRDNFKDLTKNITIDAENRITQVKDALNVTVGTYWYDEGGFRVRRTALTPQGAGFVNTEILYPNKFYGLEYVETEAVLRSINNIYLNGVRIAALNEEGTAAYFLTDQVDSVAHILDDNAHTLSRMQYEPYGETLVQRGNQNFAPKFNSQELDRETNFYFYNARYYDPQIARFTSADSVVDGARSTQGWNRFSYVTGNPIGAKDPTGHVPVKECGPEMCGESVLPTTLETLSLSVELTFGSGYVAEVGLLREENDVGGDSIISHGLFWNITPTLGVNGGAGVNYNIINDTRKNYLNGEKDYRISNLNLGFISIGKSEMVDDRYAKSPKNMIVSKGVDVKMKGKFSFGFSLGFSQSSNTHGDPKRGMRMMDGSKWAPDAYADSDSGVTHSNSKSDIRSQKLNAKAAKEYNNKANKSLLTGK